MLDNEISYIGSLIEQKKENEICDFKLKWPDKLDGIIKDIICFSNRLSNNNAYIIFGIEDQTKDIIGVENTTRYDQAKLTDCLKKYPFAEHRPNITVDTICVNKHDIDIITIKPCISTPIYLTKDFKKLRSGFIYTRINDSNGSTEDNIEPKLIENLWKKRFHLLDSDIPRNRINYLLADADNWEKGISSDSKIFDLYYYKFDPRYKCYLKQDDMNRKRIQEFSVKQCDPTITYNYFECAFENTTIYSCIAIYLDGGRFIDLYPHQRCVGNKKETLVNYFVKDSTDWVVRNFLIYKFNQLVHYFRKDQQIFKEDIICFKNIDEKEDFFCFLENTFDFAELHPVDKEETLGAIKPEDRKEIEFYQESLRYTKAIVNLFNKWKSQRNKL